VLIGGRDVTGTAPHRRSAAGLGRSFQDARLFPSMTVREVLALAHDRHLAERLMLSAAIAVPDQRLEEDLLASRVEELIGVVGLEAFADKFVSELSTGSRRIVDLACSLAHDPAVLLLDEPSSGIAQRETEALGPLLKAVQNLTGTTLVVIEHDMPLITSIADRIVALDLGRVIATGTPDEVVHHPDVVRSYLGADTVAVTRSGRR
jgi:branched-chain amino acid transport system ATP-binding protein